MFKTSFTLLGVLLITQGFLAAQSYDAEAEQRILSLTNEARAQAGLPPLKIDDGLTAAARRHSALMASQKLLSHDLPGEPPLPVRLAATSNLRLSGEGENVGVAPGVDETHQGFMQSPHHRENLLDADFNMVGFGVVHSGRVIYVTQDFARAMPVRSAQDAADLLVTDVNHARSQNGLSNLKLLDGSQAESTACAMAHADSLKTPAPKARYVIRFTTAHPDVLPRGTEKAINDAAMQSFAVGTCYGRTETYPSGVYWVVVLLN